ncbi:MAG: hypothetical protein ACRC30_14720 [Clostridium sp.]
MDIRVLNNRVRYDFIRLLDRRNILIFSFFTGVYVFLIFNSPYTYLEGLNLFDVPIIIQMENTAAIQVICMLSVYLSSMIFVDRCLDPFVKIRIKSKREWFVGKVVSVIMINIVLFIIITGIGIIIGVFVAKLGLGWGKGVTTRLFAYPYAGFYSQFRLIVINMSIFISLMSAIGIISGLIYVKVNKGYVGIIISYIYMIGSNAFIMVAHNNLFSLIIFYNYICFARRNYMNTFEEGLYLTVREAMIYPGILLGIVCLVGYALIKHMEFKIESKDNG